MKHFFLSLALVLSAMAARAQVSNTFYGSLTATDPTIPGGRLNRDALATACGVAKSYPGVLATATGVHYDTYTIGNPSTSTSVCATITLTPACSQGTDAYLFCSVYLNSFDKTNLAANYRSDMGASPSVAPQSMVLTVAPREVLVLVVSGVTAASVCSAYGLTVTAPTALPVRAGHDPSLALTAYPNPVQDVLHIVSATRSAHYTLYTTTGTAVKQITGSDVSVADLPGGVYLLREEETQAVTRIVKL